MELSACLVYMKPWFGPLAPNKTRDGGMYLSCGTQEIEVGSEVQGHTWPQRELIQGQPWLHGTCPVIPILLHPLHSVSRAPPSPSTVGGTMGVLTSIVERGRHPFKLSGLSQLEQTLLLVGGAAPQLSNIGAPEGLVPKSQGCQGSSLPISYILAYVMFVRVPGCLLWAGFGEECSLPPPTCLCSPVPFTP